MAWSDDLDPTSSSYAIASTQNPRVRVLAGPGTGKSFAMKRRVARLLEAGIDPTSILPVTFTRVAAEDLHRELVGMGAPGCDQLEGVTLHSLALKFLVRQHILEATGRTPRPLNAFELKPLEKDLASHGGVFEVREKIKAYETGWARLQDQDPSQPYEPDDVAFSNDLRAWLIFHRAMLIGEVIPIFEEYLRLNPVAAERSEFAHILVDEFQDLNRAEQSVVELMSGIASVCIVGDDDQSIYSFKFAQPEGIQNWVASNPGADDLDLVDCYRCPTRVVSMANSLIGRNLLRPTDRQLSPIAAKGLGEIEIVQFDTLEAEIAGVVGRVAALVEEGTPPGDILVLAQRRVVGNPIYEGLVEAGVAVRSYYAESELEQIEAQELFSLMRLVVDRDDRVALRWLVGMNSNNWRAPSYRRVRDHCEATGQTPWDTLSALRSGTLSIPYTNPLLARFAEIVARIEELESIFATTGLTGLIDHIFPDGEAFCRDLRALSLEVLEANPEADAATYMAQLNERITKPDVPSEIEDVRIMSLHKSKGLSSPVTIVSGCIEGLLPMRPSEGLTPQETLRFIEEQRRLFFVGITRVKSDPDSDKPGRLILTNSQTMPMADALGAGLTPNSITYGRAHFNASRFLGELGPEAPAPIYGG